MINKELKYTVLSFVISLLIICWFYTDVIFDLNNVVFASGGDGLKNYYTYLFHAKYDNSFFNFSGMNYPYGENIVFTDAHPLLSFIVGKLGLANYGIGILNFLMLISYPISTIFIFKIFRHFKTELMWSVLASIALTFMAPQVFRLSGHLSMSYVFAIPIMWYLLVKTTQFNNFKWQLITIAYLLIFFFTHPYLGLILSVFTMSYWMVFMILKHKQKGIYKQSFLNIVFQVAIPIITFRLLVLLNDTHVGRLNNPAGFFNLHANLNSILVAHHGPILKIKPIFGLESGNWESWAYIGFATMFFALVSAIYVLINYKKIDFITWVKTPLFIVFIASVFVLLFSMCIPFKWSIFKNSIDYLGPLKQFRVLGRFAWVFFYVFTIFTIIIFNKIKQKTNNKLAFTVLFYCGIVMYVFEFYPVHTYVHSFINKSKNPFKIQNINNDLQNLAKFTHDKNYDALIFLPFTHMSSESVFILGTEEANYDAFLLSYHAKIPLLNTVSSRTSLKEAVSMINLFSPAYIEKELAKKITSNKRILVVTNNNLLKPDEQRMVNSSSLIFKNSSFTAYDFSFNKWNSKNSFDEVMLKSERANKKLKNNWYADSTTWFYYDGFENLKDKNAMLGNGAWAQQKKGWNKLITLDSTLLHKGDYTLSFWFNIDIDRPDVLAVAEKITPDTLEWIDEFMIRQTNLVVDNWAYVELNFSFKPTDTVNILLTSGQTNKWMVIDELLIKETNGINLFKEIKQHNLATKKIKSLFLSYNNHWINKNSFKK